MIVKVSSCFSGWTWIILTTKAVRVGELKKLVPFLNHYLADTDTYCVFWPNNRYLSSKVRAFVDYIANKFFAKWPHKQKANDNPRRQESRAIFVFSHITIIRATWKRRYNNLRLPNLNPALVILLFLFHKYTTHRLHLFLQKRTRH